MRGGAGDGNRTRDNLLGRKELCRLSILSSVSPGLKWLEAWVGFEPTSLCCEAKILLGTEQGLDALEVSCNAGWITAVRGLGLQLPAPSDPRLQNTSPSTLRL